MNININKTWLEETLAWARGFETKLLDATKDTPFWKLATAELQKKDFSHNFDAIEAMLSFVAQKKISRQLNAHSVFGDPPITLFHSEKAGFVLDIYFWSKFHTTIHDHGFEGAFQLLKGKSIELTYDFTIASKKEHGCYSGVLVPKNIHLLDPSDTHAIPPGEEFIHRVVHLEPLTVTLVLRTLRNKDIIQRNYRFDSISTPAYPDETIIIKKRVLEWMIKNRIEIPRPLVKELIGFDFFLEKLRTLGEYKDYKKYLPMILPEEKIKYLFNESQVDSLLNQIEATSSKIILVVGEFFRDKTLLKKWMIKKFVADSDELYLLFLKELKNTNEYVSGALDKIHFLQELGVTSGEIDETTADS